MLYGAPLQLRTGRCERGKQRFYITAMVNRAGFSWCEVLGQSTCEAPLSYCYEEKMEKR